MCCCARFAGLEVSSSKGKSKGDKGKGKGSNTTTTTATNINSSSNNDDHQYHQEGGASHRLLSFGLRTEKKISRCCSQPHHSDGRQGAVWRGWSSISEDMHPGKVV